MYFGIKAHTEYKMNAHTSSLTASSNCFKRTNTSAEYHADKDILSSSMLKNALISPAHYISSLLEPHTDTPDKAFGTLIHAMVLEPQTVSTLIAVYAGNSKDRKDWTAFKAANSGRYCLTHAALIQAQLMSDMARSAMFRGRPFYKYVEEGEVEPSIHYADPTTGISCRTRPDLLHPDFTFDLKTTRHSLPSQFQKDGVSMHYDLSAYMYTLSRVLIENTPTPKPFVLVPVDSNPPHGTHFMPCSAAFLENGMKKYNTALSTIKACSLLDHWPTLDGEIEMDLMPWQVFIPPQATWRSSTPV